MTRIGHYSGFDVSTYSDYVFAGFMTVALLFVTALTIVVVVAIY